MRALTLTACLALTASTAGCKKAEQEAPPPPPKPTKQVAKPSSQPAAPAHRAASQPGASAAKPFSGLLKLGEGVTAADINPTDVLFVMARESQGGGLAGRLVAVQRFGEVKFPLRYELGPKDVMVPGIPFAGPFIVTARLDRDGDPMTRGENDLYATFADPVKPGAEGVHLLLKKGAPKTMKAPAGTKAPGAASQPSKAVSQPAR